MVKWSWSPCVLPYSSVEMAALYQGTDVSSPDTFLVLKDTREVKEVTTLDEKLFLLAECTVNAEGSNSIELGKV
uniref:Uncharacterized protein n=1 Tax=Oncorhynchus tshawytscha TaxID=74940 RepID=A0A8C8C999_ONCTS